MHAAISRLALPFKLTKVGLVNFHNAAVAAHRRKRARAQRLADAVRHKPRRLQGDAQGAVKLVRADALLARHHQEDRLKPEMQLDMAALKDGAHFDGEGLA